MGTANTRRKKSLLMNRMAYARTQVWLGYFGETGGYFGETQKTDAGPSISN